MQHTALKKGLVLMKKAMALTLCVSMAWPVAPAMAAPGDVTRTPVTPMELPIEVEIELSPAGSLKQAPLWKELIQLLESPYGPDGLPGTADDGTIIRRPSFTATPLPALNVFPLDYNFLTGQPMRLRTNDGEVSWDQPGPLFDPAESVPLDDFNTPTALRTPIGELVTDADNNLVVSNPDGHPAIPPDGTIVAVPAVVNGVLQELIPGTTTTEDVSELEIPINETDFLAGDTPAARRDSRVIAEVLGKALFWDMQVGSDGVQACGTCHFHAGVDSRSRNQLNPGVLGGDGTFQVKGVNQNVGLADFPFHSLVDPDIPGEPLANPGNIAGDANDVMSSMGVIFRKFEDIPPIGRFLPPVNGVAALPPDIGTVVPDPVPVFQGVRRVEPRHTPTMHSAAFNFDNFWDGRARFHFNGGSVFGPSDPTAHIFIDDAGLLVGATNGHLRPELILEGEEIADQPVRIKFSSLASQAVGPPLSNFEMSFDGRNWAKIGKKLLQAGVTPLASQLVAVNDSRLGAYSNQGGEWCIANGRATAADKPGLCVSYPELIQQAFAPAFWGNTSQHLHGTAAACANVTSCGVVGPTNEFFCGNNFPRPEGCDPFDGYVLNVVDGPAAARGTSQFTQMEANFSLFFGLAVQMYEELLIPDDTPADRFFDANPLAGHAVGEPGDQAVLFPTLIPGLVNPSGVPNADGHHINLVPDDPATPEYDGFGPDEVFGFDIFAGANLTAALAPGSPRNPVHPIVGADGPLVIAVGSNPFTRSAKCMLCHLGPEQTDHSINISHGLLKNGPEFEYPTPPRHPDPDNIFGDGELPAPEPSGAFTAVGGLILAEELEGPAQDAVEVEPRNFASFDDPATPWDDRVVGQPGNFAFGDQGVYNIGLRPSAEDLGRGGNDAFGWTLSLSALTLKNIGGQDFEPNDHPGENNVMAGFDPLDLGATFEEAGGGLEFPGAPGYTLESVNPGFERDPLVPQMPEYMAPWMHALPAGELHPQIDEMAGMVPNTLTPPNGGPGIEFPEIMFGADLHCATYDPAAFGAGPPNFGWGAVDPVTGEPVPGLCPNSQSGVANNFAFPVHGTWPVPNRVLRDGAFKAPQLRNVELTGPYFHTGSYLTLRQVVDFYMRGGDFPITNAEARDPHIVDLDQQAFAFGRTTGDDLTTPVVFPLLDPILVGTFADGLPDTAFLYDAMPDTDHAVSPEYATTEDAKNALVKFMLSLTDPRVKYERAPFDRPEIFVPKDGRAPDNTLGRSILLADDRFVHLPAVGAAGRFLTDGVTPDPLPNFLRVSSTQGDAGPDHFDGITTPTPIAELTLRSPNGGETLLAGEQYEIAWNGPKAHHYRLEFSQDNGTTWQTIPGAEHLPRAARSFSWTVEVPRQRTSGNLVRVLAFSPKDVRMDSDRSNRPFTIELMKVTNPSFGGEILVSGEQYNLEWHIHETRGNVGSMRLEFTLNDGRTWKQIALLNRDDSFAPAVSVGHDWAYRWIVPNVHTARDTCRVRVVLTTVNGAIVGSDISNKFFTIQPTL